MESIRAHAQILKCLLFKIDISTPPPPPQQNLAGMFIWWYFFKV